MHLTFREQLHDQITKNITKRVYYQAILECCEPNKRTGGGNK